MTDLYKKVQMTFLKGLLCMFSFCTEVKLVQTYSLYNLK